MSRELTEIELAKALLLKTVRAMVRLKHSLAAERELNEVLPRVEEEFNQAIHKGELMDARRLSDMAKEALDGDTP